MITSTILDLVQADHRSKAYRQARLLFGMPIAEFLAVNEAFWQAPIMSADEAIRIWLCKNFQREMNHPRKWEENKALDLLFCGATRAEYLRQCLCWNLGLNGDASMFELRAACVADFRELAACQFFYHRSSPHTTWFASSYREPAPWEPRGAEHESFGDMYGFLSTVLPH